MSGEREARAEFSSAWLEGIPYRLWRANQAVNKRVVEAIAPLGITVTQLGIMVHLDELGHMSASDLARLFGLTPQSTTTALNHLEKLGWVVRIPHPMHRRVVWYEVTPAGKAAADDGRSRVNEVDDEIRAVLADVDETAFDDALTVIRETFGGALPTGTMWPVPGDGRARP